MIANNNVILKGSDNKKLKSEQLIWDKKKNLVYTESEITIQTDDEIISGVGFKSTPDFEEYEIKNAKGVFSLEK
jgi:lipopolysaccharide assembly outer membrane protein LptD (OstA)